ncbi:nitrilase-related carbon-nitrogen hydrolase [Actinomadura sp. HBU206391]|uniref:nitrilase-related carbon-nitrogen hydrolase n=1 Tax=Actinomadura sp. HBU206391 TaxID=2731692 RepID=UPI001650C488|nr:nitrilase-related carbon-nitrogen hydrolase [Actinomadura sp. HBU206391]MBC6459614.1 hypothetical protein [Actinomadura sp. HBU206391]
MNPTRWRFAAVLAAAASSATLFYFGTGLRPLPWLTWLAPLPVLALAPRVGALAVGGARVVVLPEKTFVADDASLSLLAGPLSRLAAERRIDIIAGVTLTRGGITYNAAMDFPADGGRSVDYFKHHLIPGFEGEFAAGSEVAFVPGSGRRWGIAICKDLDFPGLVRDYRGRGATAVLVPAWDFDVDAWLHSRMAVTRGVESGLTVARAARAGALTVSDPRGRVVAEARTEDAEFVSVTAGLPIHADPTLYARFGDWFAWACVGLLAGAGALLRGRPIR